MLDLALIPARGGSVGLPGKNVLELGGLPLIAWTVRAALASEQFARVVVSTDSEEIAAVARVHGAQVPFIRPAQLATATAGSAEVVAHALEALGVDGGFALLQPTSPFRNARHLCEAAQLHAASGAPGLVAVTAAKPLEWLRRIGPHGRLGPALEDLGEVTRRQDADPLVLPNGSIYLTDAATFRRARSLSPPDAVAFRMSSIDSLDIDYPEDFDLARAVVTAGLRRPD